MNIFRALLHSPVGMFLIDIWHDKQNVECVNAYHVRDGIVQEKIDSSILESGPMLPAIESLWELAKNT